ncbi:hypothetical protein MF406_05160 [Georgenia sp. TF02-10]|uniref:hypothetical protein n=1 Tax=Georgenia sp. TF02-10 TaxID=2917725 RepID=UPI001FA70C2A|nr:hypothetical protein [Georgenia sp. TF02-10]UNX55639.1 hypothetical protein MF406_05160 [Georgenia sp. TF02-10]
MDGHDRVDDPLEDQGVLVRGPHPGSDLDHVEVAVRQAPPHHLLGGVDIVGHEARDDVKSFAPQGGFGLGDARSKFVHVLTSPRREVDDRRVHPDLENAWLIHAGTLLRGRSELA